jgi:23S rRNA maturation-related 3'-5' exoribonuclease YhaM
MSKAVQTKQTNNKVVFPYKIFETETQTDQRYKEVTNYVVSHERSNFDKITLYATSKEFWHCTENSALILGHRHGRAWAGAFGGN